MRAERLSPEIQLVPKADAVHIAEGNIDDAKTQGIARDLSAPTSAGTGSAALYAASPSGAARTVTTMSRCNIARSCECSAGTTPTSASRRTAQRSPGFAKRCGTHGASGFLAAANGPL